MEIGVRGVFTALVPKHVAMDSNIDYASATTQHLEMVARNAKDLQAKNRWKKSCVTKQPAQVRKFD